MKEILMENVIPNAPTIANIEHTPRALVWTGRILSGLLITFLLLDAVGKLIPLAPYVEGTQKAGYSVDLVRPLGLVLLVPTLLHLLPRTQLFGALLLTAYFGGAVAPLTHPRHGRPLPCAS
jgi:hypothetical protein